MIYKILREKCGQESINFTRCKHADPDPAACQKQGLEATNCLARVHQQTVRECGDVYEQYTVCLEDNRGLFSSCREIEAKVKECVMTKF